MGGDLGGTRGTVLPKMLGGGRPMYPPPPPTFGEVVLLEACKSSKGKNGVKEKLF